MARWLSLAILLLAVGCNQIPPGPVPTPTPIVTASPVPTPTPTPIWANNTLFCTELHTANMNDPAVVTQLVADGVKCVRVDFDARLYVSQEATNFNWSPYNKFYQTIWVQHKIRPIFIMSYSDKIPFDQSLYTAIHVQATTNYPEAWWEGYNEPDGHFLTNSLPDSTLYIQNILPPAQAMRQANPTVRLITGGLSTLRWDWVANFNSSGMFSTFDTFGLHLYHENWNNYYPDMEALASTLPMGTQVAVTEFGVIDPVSQTINQYWGTSSQMHMLLFNWYEYQDDGTQDFQRYGIYDLNLTPKDSDQGAIRAINGV